MNKVERIAQSVLFGSQLPTPLELDDADFYTLHSDCFKQPCVCVLGVFDGLHEGHQGLLAIAKKDAEARKVPLVAVTFLPDPVEVLFEGSPQRLLSGKDRLRALAAWGVDGILVHHFTREFAALSGTQYVESELLPCVPAVSVHVGSDFGLGAQGAEGSALLSSLGRQHGFEVHSHELFCSGGEKISATRIRNLLGQGRVEDAASLLGRWHFVSGVVKHGRGQGTGFGFPTANVALDVRDCIPQDGVYACYVVHGATAWPAAVNVGKAPSFESQTEPLLEANLLGFSGNLYDSQVQTVFVKRLRESKKFDSLEELKCAVRGNIDWVAQNLGTTSYNLGSGEVEDDN